MAITIAEMQKSALFATMTEQELKTVLPACTEEKVKRRTTLFSQGAPGSDFFIIADGQIVLEKLLRSRTSDTSRQTVVRVYGTGETIGWSCITTDTYTASAVTGRDSSVIRVDARKLREILDARSRMGYKFMSALARQIVVQMGYLEDSLMTERAMVNEEAHKRAAAKRTGGLVSARPEEA